MWELCEKWYLEGFKITVVNVFVVGRYVGVLKGELWE